MAAPACVVHLGGSYCPQVSDVLGFSNEQPAIVLQRSPMGFGDQRHSAAQPSAQWDAKHQLGQHRIRESPARLTPYLAPSHRHHLAAGFTFSGQYTATEGTSRFELATSATTTWYGRRLGNSFKHFSRG